MQNQWQTVVANLKARNLLHNVHYSVVKESCFKDVNYTVTQFYTTSDYIAQQYADKTDAVPLDDLGR